MGPSKNNFGLGELEVFEADRPLRYIRKKEYLECGWWFLRFSGCQRLALPIASILNGAGGWFSRSGHPCIRILN